MLVPPPPPSSISLRERTRLSVWTSASQDMTRMVVAPAALRMPSVSDKASRIWSPPIEPEVSMTTATSGTGLCMEGMINLCPFLRGNAALRLDGRE